MQSALEMLQLDKLHRYDVETKLPSGNWKATADGYVDGYHLGYLHRKSIGVKSITNRNTYDLYGPHVRIGFANKPILEHRDVPPEEWPDTVRLPSRSSTTSSPTCRSPASRTTR